VTIEEFLANTVEAIQAKAAEAVINDPTVRPGIVEITPDDAEFNHLEDNTVNSEDGTEEDPENHPDNVLLLVRLSRMRVRP
jgi:hypothetical protein